MSYRIEFTPSAARNFKKLDGPLRHRIAPKIDALAAEPRPYGAEKLVGQENRYRVRAGDYRIIYVINDNPRVVTVAVIGHRREVYR